MAYENTCFETEGQLAVITLNRPNRRNALSLELMLELIDYLGCMGGDRSLRTVVPAAAGKVFSSGHDLSEIVRRDINEYRRTFDVCAELMTKVQSIPQPVMFPSVFFGPGFFPLASLRVSGAARPYPFVPPG